MLNQPDQGTSAPQAHSERSAAEAIMGLLSDEEDTQPDEATPEDHESQAPEDHDEEEHAESGSEEQDQPDEDEEPEVPAAPRTRKIKLPDGEVDVTDEELEKGYMRTSDYTRKTQELAEKRKGFEAEHAAGRENRARVASQLIDLEQALTALSQEPDWARLEAENPAELPKIHAAWRAHQEQMKDLAAKRQEAVEAVNADMNKQRDGYLSEQRGKLLEALPAWNDAAVARKERAELLEYGQTQGFTEEQVRGVDDHRALLMLRKAMLYDRAEAAKAAAKPRVQEKIDKAKTSIQPGANGQSKGRTAEVKRREQRLKTTGSDKDAASLIELMLDD